MPKFLELAWLYLKTRVNGEARPLLIFSFDSDGIYFEFRTWREKTNGAIRWSNVETVMAFKRDCFGYDLICLQIADSDISWEIHENDDKWSDLTDALPTLLPGCKPLKEWWAEVAFPPFETRENILFSRARQESH